MTVEEADILIERQGVYEIEYEKEDEESKVWHISRINYDKQFGHKCIKAFCQECDKDLVFNLKRIVSAKECWHVILSKSETVPKDGVYLIARVGIGQGFDIDYVLLNLREGDVFSGIKNSWSKPIAYHIVPSYDEEGKGWSKKEIVFQMGNNEEVPALKDGIPIICFRDMIDHPTTRYCIGYSENDEENPQDRVWHGVKKGTDITTFFKDSTCYESFGWSERWNGYIMVGFYIAFEFDFLAYKHQILSSSMLEDD